MGIRVIRAKERHFQDFGWLQTYWLFSFSDYYDPMNLQFGNLRVFNDDVIQPKKGFPAHSHADMEIVTIVHEGELTHEDDTGAVGVLGKGEVQRMTAGRGITHSESNKGRTPVRLYQVWLLPRKKGLSPGYEQKRIGGRKNSLVPLASGSPKGIGLRIEADATISRGELEKGEVLKVSLGRGRGAFLYMQDGKLDIGEVSLEPGDQARVQGQRELALTARDQTRFILIETAV